MTGLDVSTEHVVVSVEYRVRHKLVDVSGSYVGYLAFKTRRKDKPGNDFNAPEWHVAQWETGNGETELVVLRGPGGVMLAPGVWHVFFGLDGTPQIPIKYAGPTEIE